LARAYLAAGPFAAQAAWARDHGPTLFERLASTRLDSASSYDPLPRSAWSVLLEKALPAAPPEVDPLRLLMDNGLLRTCSEGGLELTPWLRAAFEQEWLRIRVPHDDFPWEIYALDPARRAMLDRALDEQSPSKLIERATWALACDARDLRFVAAVEALFAAAARRLDRWQPTKAQLPVLQALGHRQLTLMQSLPAGAGFPQAALTRRNSGDAGRAATAWVGEAWWFSLHVTPPRLDSDPGWLMPGWSGSLDLASAPPNLPLPHPAVSLFDRAARLVVGHVRTAPLGDVHASLRPWVLLDGPGRGWEIPRAIQQQVARLPASAELVVHALASEDAISRQRGAALLWQAFLSDTEQQPLLAWRRVERSTPAVRSFVRENLAVAAFLEPWSSSTSIPEGDSGLELLPPRLMRAALRALLSQQKAGPIPPVPLLAALVESLGDEDLDLLGELGSGGFEHGYVAARKLWDLAPSVATKHAREQLASGDERAQVWFDTAPAMQHEKLLQLLQERRRELPAWCATWIVSALPRAAGVARALYAELRTHQEFAAPEAKLRVPLRGALPRGRSECVHESPPDGGEVAAPAIESARSPRRRSSTGRGVSAGNPRGKS
jgi:hypothetical protein